MNHYDFGNYLTEKRKSIGYSQFQFGKLLGVSGKAVSKWETGASVPKLETLTKIASLTGTDLGDLVSMREVGDFEITKIRRSKKAAFWNREENRLAEIYGDDVPLSILDRYYTEKESSYSSIQLNLYSIYLQQLIVTSVKMFSHFF